MWGLGVGVSLAQKRGPRARQQGCWAIPHLEGVPAGDSPVNRKGTQRRLQAAPGRALTLRPCAALLDGDRAEGVQYAGAMWCVFVFELRACGARRTHPRTPHAAP
jgi:hypothetical protein